MTSNNHASCKSGTEGSLDNKVLWAANLDCRRAATSMTHPCRRAVRISRDPSRMAQVHIDGGVCGQRLAQCPEFGGMWGQRVLLGKMYVSSKMQTDSRLVDGRSVRPATLGGCQQRISRAWAGPPVRRPLTAERSAQRLTRHKTNARCRRRRASKPEG